MNYLPQEWLNWNYSTGLLLWCMPSLWLSEVTKVPGKNRISQLKCHCIVDESYQTAKTYKFISDRLARFSKILVEFEQAKRHAVDTKDYDEAEKIKGDINEIKQAAESIIKQANIRITDDGQVVPLNEDLVRPSQKDPHMMADLFVPP
jgi:hypothetical protein